MRMLLMKIVDVVVIVLVVVEVIAVMVERVCYIEMVLVVVCSCLRAILVRSEHLAS